MFKISQSDSLTLSFPEKNIESPVSGYRAHSHKFIVTSFSPSLPLRKKGRIRPLKKISPKNFSPSSLNGRWTKEEHNRFIEAIISFGNDWKKVQKHVHSRTSTQARSHAQKFLLKLKHSDFFKKKKIDINLSWAKTIQYLKNEFSNEELNDILRSVTNRKKASLSNNKKALLLDDSHTAFSTSTEADYNNNNSSSKNEDIEYEDYYLTTNAKKKEDNSFNDNEYIKNFIQNFNFKSDLDFDLNELNMVYFNHNKNTIDY